jgi:hypothetical protein
MSNVAKSIGMDLTSFHHLTKGNVEKMGNIASVFHREYMKILDKMITEGDKKISGLLNQCQDVSLTIIQRELEVYRAKKTLKASEQKMVTFLTRAMASLKPSAPRSLSVSQSWHYTKGLSVEELGYEYSRLRGLAEGPPNAGGVQAPVKGGSGVLHPPTERGSGAEEIEEDLDLSADGEAA